MRLLVPAGAGGAVFLVGGNFDAIRSYNASDSYALSIALLGDQIAGRGILPTRWPTANPPIGRADAMQMQNLLLALGYQVGTPDGQIGPRSRAALQALQKKENLVADGYPSAIALANVRTVAAREGISLAVNPTPAATPPQASPPPVVPARSPASPSSRLVPPPPSKTDPNYTGPPPVKMKW
jgi:membrane-bound lytic murein transglycosylase B